MHFDPLKRLTSEELAKPVGALISAFPWLFRGNQTVEETIRILQTSEKKRRVDFVYITDNDDSLLGVISTKDLLHALPETQLEDLIHSEILKIYADEPVEKALKMVSEYKILILPVVDQKNRFLGVLDLVLDEPFLPFKSSRIEQRDLKQDLFQFIGFTLEQSRSQSSWQEFRYRMPWLSCNLFGGLACAFIGEFFQHTLTAFVVLALFIPLVLTLSESVAIQSMSFSLRFLHIKRIHWPQVFRRLIVEWKTSFLIGVCCAFFISLFYFAWSEHIPPLFAIAISLILAILGSATFGTLFPIILHLFRLDPKVAAGPVILMMTDILTVTVYLSFSTHLLT